MTTPSNNTVTLLKRKGRIQFLPLCAAAKAYAAGKMRKYITLHDVNTLEHLGFKVEYTEEAKH